jgi:hypothetical protein
MRKMQTLACQLSSTLILVDQGFRMFYQVSNHKDDQIGKVVKTFNVVWDKPKCFKTSIFQFGLNFKADIDL